MKKVIILGLGVMAFSMTSCFKSSNCKCTTTYKADNTTTTNSYPVTSFGGGKSQRKAWCAANEQDDTYSKTVCELTK